MGKKCDQKAIYYMRGDLLGMKNQVAGDEWSSYARKKFNPSGEIDSIWTSNALHDAAKMIKLRKALKAENIPAKPKLSGSDVSTATKQVTPFAPFQQSSKTGGGFKKQEQSSKTGVGFKKQEQSPQAEGGFKKQEQSPQTEVGFSKHEQSSKTGGGFKKQEQSPQTEVGFSKLEQSSKTGGGFKKQEQSSKTGVGFKKQEQSPQAEGGFKKQEQSPQTEGGFSKHEQSSKTEGGFSKHEQSSKTEGGFSKHARGSGPSYRQWPKSMTEVVERTIDEMIMNEDAASKSPIVIRRSCNTIEKSIAARQLYMESAQKKSAEKDKLARGEEAIEKMKSMVASMSQPVVEKPQISHPIANQNLPQQEDAQRGLMAHSVGSQPTQQTHTQPMAPGYLNLLHPSHPHVLDSNMQTAYMQRYNQLFYHYFHNLRM